MAHKKAAGSAKNLRDSNPKFRWIKLSGGQFARAGNIIVRQKGDKYQLGRGVYKGTDFTIHAAIDGVVSFGKRNVKRYDGRKYLRTVVEVLPAGTSTKITAPAQKTTPVKAKVAPKKTEKVAAPAKKIATTETDDLTKIEGIGPKINEVFHANWIATFADLSISKVGDLRTLLADNGLAQHDPKTWKKQATLAKNGKWDELKVLQDELDWGK